MPKGGWAGAPLTRWPLAYSNRLPLAWLWRLATGNSALTMVDQIIFSAGNFLTAAVVARTCGQQDFGLYFLGLRLIDYLREMANVLIWSPYMFLSPGLEADEHSRYTGSTLIHQLAFSLASGGLFMLGGLVAIAFDPSARLGEMFFPLALVAGMMPLQEYSRRICFANLRVSSVILLDGLVTVIQIAGLAWLAAGGLMSVKNTYWLIGLANGAVAVGWALCDRPKFRFAQTRIVPDFRRNFALGKWLLGGNLTLLVGQQIFPWALGFSLGTAATGLYAAGESIVNFIRVFMVSMQNHLGPSLSHAWAKGGGEELQRVVRKSSQWLSLVVSGLAVIVGLAGGVLVRLIYGSRYDGLEALIALLAASVLVQAATTCHAYALTTVGHPAANFRINLIGLAVSISAGLSLISMTGPLGAAAGSLIVALTTSTLRLRAYAKHVH